MAILDGQVMPEQYTPERIRRQAVQDLLTRVVVRPNDAYTARFPQEMPCFLRVSLRDGRVLVAVFAWYIKNYGPEVNLFVDHSQIVQLETLRAGIWGTKSLWGRVLTYKEE